MIKKNSLKKISEWELRTHSQSVFRVLGMPFGIVESAARIFCLSEIVSGGAVAYLVKNQKKISLSTAKKITVEKKTPTTFVIDAWHQTVFSVGESALDLTILNSVNSGFGHTCIKNLMAPYYSIWLLYAASKRGLLSIIHFNRKSVGPVYAIALPNNPTKVYELAIDPGDPLTREMDRILTKNIFVPKDSVVLNLTCFSAKNAEPLIPFFESQINVKKFKTLDIEKKWAHACRHGIFINSIIADKFFELGRSLWLPTSDRSKSQGSIGLN